MAKSVADRARRRREKRKRRREERDIGVIMEGTWPACMGECTPAVVFCTPI
jgi:hypothetical protein